MNVDSENEKRPVVKKGVSNISSNFIPLLDKTAFNTVINIINDNQADN